MSFKTSQILAVPFIFFICTAVVNILGVTHHSNPSQKLRLVGVIKNLELEVIQP